MKAGLQHNIKVGGCEAKTDIFFCEKLGVNGIVAPMVETGYALRKFLQIISKNKRQSLYVNLESIQAFKNIKDILKAKEFKKIIKFYNQYDWGVIENFYISVCEVLKLKKTNLFKKLNVIKFENDFKSFSEDRSWQINSWKENQKYFVKFLKKYNLSKLYAFGSYYYLLYKLFNFKDLNFNLFLSYLIFYPYNLFKKISNYLK